MQISEESKRNYSWGVGLVRSRRFRHLGSLAAGPEQVSLAAHPAGVTWPSGFKAWTPLHPSEKSRVLPLTPGTRSVGGQLRGQPWSSQEVWS